MFSESHGRWVQAEVLHFVPSNREVHVRYQLPGETPTEKWISTESAHVRIPEGTQLLPSPRNRNVAADAAAVIGRESTDGSTHNGPLVHQAMAVIADGHRDAPGTQASSAVTTAGMAVSQSQSQAGGEHVEELRERTQSESRVLQRAVQITAAAQAAEQTIEHELATTERELSSLQLELGIHADDERTLYSVVEQHEDEFDEEDDTVDGQQSVGTTLEEDVFAPTTLSARGLQAFDGELTVHIINAGALRCR